MVCKCPVAAAPRLGGPLAEGSQSSGGVHVPPKAPKAFKGIRSLENLRETSEREAISSRGVAADLLGLVEDPRPAGEMQVLRERSYMNAAS